jgi:hypothetical protein
MSRRDRELDEEIQAHLAMAKRDRIASGETPEAAELAARREFGNTALIREVTREMWGWTSLERLWQDVRYALRMMRRSPGFTAVAVLSLALGIGANTAIFSLIHALMLHQLPVQDPEQLVELLTKYPGQDRWNAFSWQAYQHMRDHNQVFSGLIAASNHNYGGFFHVRAEGLEPERVGGEYVVGNFFTVLGVKPAIGRVVPKTTTWRCSFAGGRGELAVLEKQVQSGSGNHWQANPGGRYAGDDYRCDRARAHRLAGRGKARPLATTRHGAGHSSTQLHGLPAQLVAAACRAVEAGCVHRAGARRNGGAVPADHRG